ncbi:MAG: hypothetical protein M1827_003495 [Pycnora praestabilis]|nr:MAG: hypothetical protein M1827_003495 [Pycnora praestabilis]
MPKGHKIINWTAENDMKLFHTIMSVHDLKIDYAAVATAMGPGIPANCISQRMCKLRKIAGESGIAAKPMILSNKRARAPAHTTDNVNKKVKKEIAAENEDDEGETTAATPPATPGAKMTCDKSSTEIAHAHSFPKSAKVLVPSTPISSKNLIDDAATTPCPKANQVQRISPRGAKKVEYRELDDPYTDAANNQRFRELGEDADTISGIQLGEEIVDHRDSEDSAGSDGEFKPEAIAADS